MRSLVGTPFPEKEHKRSNRIKLACFVYSCLLCFFLLTLSLKDVSAPHAGLHDDDVDSGDDWSKKVWNWNLELSNGVDKVCHCDNGRALDSSCEKHREGFN